MSGPILSKLLCQICSGWLEEREDKTKKCRICGYTTYTGRENMISMNELLSGNKLEDQSPEIQANLQKLLTVMNKVRVMYDKAMIVTSGLRSLAHHLAIYAAKGITDQSKIPMKSKHLFGLAVDIQDTDGKLAEWCKAHEQELLALGVYIEMLDKTPGWVHFQIEKYASWIPGKSIFFNP